MAFGLATGLVGLYFFFMDLTELLPHRQNIDRV